MANYTFANLDQWVTKTEKVLDAVVSHSAMNLMSSIDVAPGTSRGGSREHGTIPRDLGFLAASLQSSLNGGTAMSGVTSYAFIAGSMKSGDIGEFGWTAPYAMANHYGTSKIQGTFWIDVAANKWPQFVAGAVLKAKAAIK